MKIEEKIEKYLVNENEKEDIAKAKKLVNYHAKANKNDLKKTRRALLDNVVNNEYSRVSNDFITILWNEFNKKFPS